MPFPDIDDTPRLADDDRQCMDEVRAVLSRHGKLDHFGLLLLHSHFPVAENELLVETCDRESRVLTIRPRDRADLGTVRLRETAWRLDTDASLQECVFACVEGVNYSHYDRHVPRRDEEPEEYRDDD